MKPTPTTVSSAQPHRPTASPYTKFSPSPTLRRLSDRSKGSDVSPTFSSASHLQYNPSSSSIGSGASSHSHRPTSSDANSRVGGYSTAGHRKMPIKRSIEAAYQRMVVLSEEPGKCPFGALPAKFKLVYKSDVVVHFVNAVLLYMNSFVNKTIQLQQQLQQQREQKEHREQQNLDIADQKRPNPEPTSCSLISPLVMMSDHQVRLAVA